ncbi:MULTISPECIES: diguanylate cyclase domain-containing protein [Sutcliffiella]|uniref:GGDEF domain-containing protein n=1 Tax=Sutcliffiella cohnii TaxID=33932 RepID=A0A223KVR1_9BACI|nr:MULTISPECIES: diguanylate cyclase [Sutcliffiella]AST93565.1 hypothetical protein BC6307_20990 [Sutcliffiella cohnii]WBL14753.1 diguanylate cyclase [Sutcliffiella sp. NC1]
MNSYKIYSRVEIEEIVKDYCTKTTHDKISMVLIDIDNSRKYFGEVIKSEIIDVILLAIKNIYNTDMAFRVGRDTFAFVIKEGNLLKLAKKKDQLQIEISKRTNLKLTFCMGIGIVNNDIKVLYDKIASIYDALFTSKKEGSNNIEIANEQNMKLKSFYLRKSQLERLALYCKNEKMSEALIIRKSLDEYLDRNM